MKVMTIKQDDGSTWAVPVEVIARDRAANYASEFGGDVERSLAEDTLPLFESDPWEIQDWSGNNMNWSDVQAHAWKLRDAPPPDFQEAWMNGERGYEEVSVPASAPAATSEPGDWPPTAPGPWSSDGVERNIKDRNGEVVAVVPYTEYTEGACIAIRDFILRCVNRAVPPGSE